MKRTILALMMLIVTTGAVSAQTAGKGTQRGSNKNCPAYVDNNKDGVCDNVGTTNCPYSKGQGQGREKCRMAAGRGQNCNGQGLRNGSGRGNGAGQGRNFIDANNNGICDNFENSTKKP